MRRAHLLRANKGARLPNLLIAFDTETDSIPVSPGVVEARLRFGWLAVTRRHRGQRWTPPRWRRFTTPGELWKYVEMAIPNEWRGLLVAHNVGFDFRVCDGFGLLPERGWQLQGAVIDDPPTILRWRKDRRSILVLDTVNYYRTSLKTIGKTFGLEKLDMPEVWGDRERDDAYCRRDVEIVLHAMQGIIRRTADLELGNFAPTFPGLAFTAFRHRHLSTPVLIDDNPKALTVARRSYYGGRTEAYRLGEIDEAVDVYDVVSMYPSLMRDIPVPTFLRGFYRSMTVSELAVAAADAAAVADVSLDTEHADYPLLLDDKLLFPVGTFRTTLAQPELVHALEHGRVVDVHGVALYDQHVLFRSFIDEWWGRRLDAIRAGDASESDFCKRMMNGLYGKFGQTGMVYESVGQADLSKVETWTDIDTVTGVVTKYRSLAGLVQRQIGEAESRDSHPAIAATITAAGRMMLLRLMEAAGRHNVVYCDTDSLFVVVGGDASGLDPFIGTDLGQLKRERRIARLVVYGLKDYRADGVRKTKGVRATAEQIAAHVYRQDTFQGLKGAVATDNLRRQLIRTTVKRLMLTYDKGMLMPGGTIHPYRLSDGRFVGKSSSLRSNGSGRRSPLAAS